MFSYSIFFTDLRGVKLSDIYNYSYYDYDLFFLAFVMQSGPLGCGERF